MNRQQQEQIYIEIDNIYTIEESKRCIKCMRNKNNQRFGLCFRCLDSDDGNRKLDKNELKVGLAENRVQLSCNQIDVDNNKQNKILCLAMDRNRSGTIDFDEFLVSIRVKELIIKLGITNQKSYCRLSIYQVRQNREMEGQLLMILSKQIMKYKMRSVQYKVSSQSQMTENQVLDEFLVNFGDVDKNGQLTYEEWIDDYAAVLASVDNDEHFVLLMKMAWKI